MSKKAALIKDYNNKDTILVIGNYPTFENGEMGNINGISTYTYYLLTELKSKMFSQDRKIVVLADIVKGTERTVYEEDTILIDRCWRKNSLGVFIQIYSALKQYNKVSKILIHFEFNTYGSGVITSLFPFFLRKLHRNHKNITLLIHQVVDTLHSLSGHLGMKTESLKVTILNFFMTKFLWLLLGSVEKTIVHDSVFGDRLNKIRRTPIYVIPHGMIDNTEQCDTVDPRKELNLRRKDFVVLVFGFLTWYKGSDWLVDKFKKYYDATKDDTIKLVLAGGKSANLKGQPFYEHYYEKLTHSLEKYPNIIHPGFIPNSEIHEYYCAADVVVFPYRTHMSASGPLAYAMSFDRPFLISDQLSSVLDTMDVRESMYSLNLKKEDLVFKMGNSSSLFEKLMNLISDKKLILSLSELSESIKDKRVWSKTAEKFLFLIDA